MKKTFKYALMGLGLTFVTSFTYLLGYAAYSWYTSPHRKEVVQKIEDGKLKRTSLIEYILF